VRGTVHRLYIGGGGFWVRLNPHYAACEVVTYVQAEDRAVMVVADGQHRVMHGLRAQPLTFSAIVPPG